MSEKMTALERHLAQLRRELAVREPCTDAWVAAWLRLTHLEAEALRRAAGWSCGCPLCQSLPWDKGGDRDISPGNAEGGVIISPTRPNESSPQGAFTPG